LLPLLRRLAEINGELAHAGRLWIDEQNAVRLAQLEHNRLQLTGLVAVTVVGAFVVALAMGWWLSRPIGSIVRVDRAPR
jgi:two-component system sensor histidine kinase GlrK